jgi:hypothetical protein
MNSDYPPTPRLTEHARERCRQMQIGTKTVKQIIRNPSVIRDAVSGQTCAPEDHRVIVSSVRFPDYQVVYCPTKMLVVTVRYTDASRYAQHYVVVS